MSEEELIAQLRSMHWCVTTLDNGVGVSNSTVAAEAADRIEALTEQLAAARRDAEEAEAYAGELEKQLAKVEVLMSAGFAEYERRLAEMLVVGNAMAASIEGNYYIAGIATKWKEIAKINGVQP